MTEPMPYDITINGTTESLAGRDPLATLLQYLRSSGRTGTKEGCAEGDCGACTVALVHGGGRYEAVNSCLLPLGAMAGRAVVTVEGVAPDRERLHPVQQALVAEGGSQCGYCTPGFVMSMFAAYYEERTGDDRTHDDLSDDGRVGGDRAGGDRAGGDRAGGGGAGGGGASPGQWTVGTASIGAASDHVIEGNLCRCTGYLPIRRAAASLGRPAPDDPHLRALARSSQAGASPESGSSPYSRSTHVPAPSPQRPQAAPRAGIAERSAFNGAGTTWHTPATLDDALALLASDEDALPIAGGTDLGVDITKFHRRFSSLVSVEHIPELHVLKDGPELYIGSAVPLQRIERELDGRLPALDEMLRWFAARQIRNRATLGGNLGTASPIGDLPLVLLALDATIELASTRGRRTVPIADYFLGYRQTARARDELIVAARIPADPPPRVALRHAQSYKVGKRGTDDISIVASCFRIDLAADGTVRDARLAYGGVAAIPTRANAVEDQLRGATWNEATAREAGRALRDAFTPLDDHRGSAAYRVALAGNLFVKFWSEHAGTP